MIHRITNVHHNDNFCNKYMKKWQQKRNYNISKYFNAEYIVQFIP